MSARVRQEIGLMLNDTQANPKAFQVAKQSQLETSVPKSVTVLLRPLPKWLVPFHSKKSW